MIRCEKCGTWIDPSQKFCTSCGTPLRMMNQDLFPNEAVRRGIVVNGKPIEGEGANKGLLALASVIALIGAGLGGWYWFTNIPLSALPRMMTVNPQLLLSVAAAVLVPVIGAVCYLAAGNNRRSAMIHALLLGVLSAARNVMTLYRLAQGGVPLRAYQNLIISSVLFVVIAVMMAAAAGSGGKGAAVIAAVLSIILILYQMMPLISVLRLNVPDAVRTYVPTIVGAVQLLAVFFGALALMTGGKKKEPVYGWG